MPAESQRVGTAAEAYLAQRLRAAGWRVLAERFRLRAAEIDLIALDPGGVVVFIEVKARKAGGLVSGVEAVDARKRARLRRAAEVFLLQRPELRGREVRFDVVELVRDGGVLRVKTYLPGAF